jgi:hypothetical protein
MFLAYIRVRVKIMGLIVIRADWDFATIPHFCDPIISTRTGGCGVRAVVGGIAPAAEGIGSQWVQSPRHGDPIANHHDRPCVCAPGDCVCYAGAAVLSWLVTDRGKRGMDCQPSLMGAHTRTDWQRPTCTAEGGGKEGSSWAALRPTWWAGVGAPEGRPF